MFNNLPKNIKIRLITNLLGTTITTAILPFMILYISDIKGNLFAGIFSTSLVFCGYIAKMLGGYVADRYKRKVIINYSYLVIIVSILAMNISTFLDFNTPFLFISGYFTFMISYLFASPSVNALLIDSTTKEERKKVYTLSYWTTNIAMSLGFFMGGTFYSANLKILFVLFLLIFTLIYFLYSKLLYDKNNQIITKKNSGVFKDLLNNYKYTLKDIPFISSVILFALLLTGERSISGFIGINLKNDFQTVELLGHNITGVQALSLVLAINTIGVILLSVVSINATKKLSIIQTFKYGGILYLLGFAIISSGKSIPFLVLGAILNVIGEILILPIISTFQVELIPLDKRATYLAVSSMSKEGSSLLSSTLIIINTWIQFEFVRIVYLLLIISGFLGLLKIYFYSKKETAENSSTIAN
jgi:MFS family permease